jgi:hypothetical protein
MAPPAPAAPAGLFATDDPAVPPMPPPDGSAAPDAVDGSGSTRAVPGRLLAVLAAVVVLAGAAWFFLIHKSTPAQTGGIVPPAVAPAHPVVPAHHTGGSSTGGQGKGSTKPPAKASHPVVPAHPTPPPKPAAPALTRSAILSKGQAVLGVLPAQLPGWTPTGTVGFESSPSDGSKAERSTDRCLGTPAAHSVSVGGQTFASAPFSGSGSVDVYGSAAAAQRAVDVAGHRDFVRCVSPVVRSFARAAAPAGTSLKDVSIQALRVPGIAGAWSLRLDAQADATTRFIPIRVNELLAPIGRATVDYTATGAAKAKTLKADAAVLKAMTAAAKAQGF